MLTAINIPIPPLIAKSVIAGGGKRQAAPAKFPGNIQGASRARRSTRHCASVTVLTPDTTPAAHILPR